GSTELAKNRFGKEGADSPRQDAIDGCLAAIQAFSKMSKEEVQKIGLEVAVLGRNGFDVNSQEPKYRLKAMPGDFTGLQLVTLLYVAFQELAPSEDLGFDLAREYGL